MGRDLIKRYSPEKVASRDLFRFLGDIYGSGKLREFASFAVWEAFHRLGLFPQNSYLNFKDGDPLALERGGSFDPAFDESVQQFFKSRGLGINRSAHGWKRLFINARKEMFGYMDQDGNSLYKSVDNDRSAIFIHAFSNKIRSIFVSSHNTIFVSARGAVYRSSGNSGAFQKVIDLSSPESFFRHNYAMTETPDKTLIIGEYGNVWENNRWRKLPYLYFSTDDGETWKRSDFLITKGINKHVHIVRYSPLLSRLLLADGDNKKKLWVSDPATSFSSENVGWKPITRFHIQTGGYTSVVESDGKILFGTDYQGGTNFIVETKDGKKLSKRIVPDPYRRSPIFTLLPRKSKNGNEIWANLPVSTGNAKSLLMYTRDGGESWNKIIEYNSRLHSVSLMGAAIEPAEDLYCSIKDLENNDHVVYRISDD